MVERKNSRHQNNPDFSHPSTIEGPMVGKIAAVAADGRILVEFPENGTGPIPARLTSSANERLRQGPLVGREVLLVFEENDPCRPLIIDTLYSLIDEITDQATDALEVQEPEEITIDRKRIIFNAEKEIVLRCGEASITLTSSGKVLIRGNYLLSRSAGANRIKGGSVQIN